MKRSVKFLLGIFIFFAITFFTNSETFASEGIFEISSVESENSRCFAASLLMASGKYEITVSCRDLIYPPQPEISFYVIWATPQAGGNAIRLGELGIGRARFEAKVAFTSLFVTLEQNKNAKSPTGSVIMRGELEKIDFLERPTTPTPTLGEGEEETVQAPETKEPSTREKLFLALRRAGLAALLALVALVGLIFVITRSRG